jgi:saccharopine dehydrogenase-like NADP-dependent oxidoreductase
MRAVVLGGGLIGGVIAAELAKAFDVCVADADEKKAEKFRDVEFIRMDLSKEESIKEAVRGADVVVNALPGFMGFKALKTIIREGKDLVDLSFMPEDPLALDAEARAAGVTAVVDMGVAPGMSNLIAGHFSAVIKGLKEIRILASGQRVAL